jgi:lysozyme
MKTSQRGINDLILSEGLETTAYRDTKGVWTIGVGHTAAAGPPSPKAGMVITRQGAIDLLTTDLAKYEAAVNKVLPNVPQHVFDGAVSFHFNTGAIARASWPRLYKSGDLKDARASFLTWNKPPEIVKRRRREAALIFDGIYATKAVAEPVEPVAPAPSPPPPDIPKEPPAAVPESSSPVSGGTVAGTIAAGGILTTIAAAVDRWQAWLALGALIAVVAAILILARRKG